MRGWNAWSPRCHGVRFGEVSETSIFLGVLNMPKKESRFRSLSVENVDDSINVRDSSKAFV